MEVGSPPSSAGSRRGGGDREEAARGSGGAMRARVCARVRTPQGVGALLLVGGAIVGAAVYAWRRHCDSKKAKNHQRGKKEEKVPEDSGVVENEQDKVDKSDESLSREVAGVEANGLDGEKTEELHEIQAKVDEIVADELDREPVDNFDTNSSRELTDIIDDTGHGDVKKADQDSSMSGVDNEVTPNATEDVENSDESTLTISSPEIPNEEHNRHDDGADEETASTQITPLTQMTMHQPKISDEVKVENMTETVTVDNVSKHEEQKPPAQDPVSQVDSPACSSIPSLLKTAQKKRSVNPGQNETGMKLGQDSGNGELSKAGAAQGVAMVTVNRRATSMAILAIIFAVTIGLNLVMRFYSALQAA
ncbi:uncharacterized protein [Lolium perenne]|uniref:uncharacterized protein n=1 Tax=Lolium perenne TaxID=4522 RepID=UPI0021F62ABD|nr:uncharacterized protein LOC127299318 [Lolium perenne]